MTYIIGFVVGLLVVVFARLTRLDKDRAFYPTVMIVIALYYVLFAAMGGSMRALAFEGLIATVFIVMAVMGFKGSMWLVAIALVMHGVQDVFHAAIVANPGVPVWWPAFCLTADVALGGWVAWVAATTTRNA